MAQVFYGIDRGNDGNGVVTVDTTDTGKEIQIVVTTGVGVIRKDVDTYGERLIRFAVHEDTASVLVG